MGLRGTLSDVGPLEAIQMIALQNRTGTLTVRSGGEKIAVDFIDGAILAVHGRQAGRRDPLVRFVEELRIISKEDVSKWLEGSRQSTADPLDVLQGLEFLSEGTLQEIYSFFLDSIMERLLRMRRGRFNFHADDPRLIRCLRPRGADSLLLEGLRRRDEVDDLLSGPLPPEVVPVLLEADTAEEDRVPDSAMSGRITEAVRRMCDGRWRLREILERSALTQYDIVTTITKDLEGGRIRLVGNPATPSFGAERRKVGWRAAVPVFSLIAAVAVAWVLRTTLEQVPAPALGREILTSPRGRSEAQWIREEAQRQSHVILQEILPRFRELPDSVRGTPGNRSRGLPLTTDREGSTAPRPRDL